MRNLVVTRTEVLDLQDNGRIISPESDSLCVISCDLDSDAVFMSGPKRVIKIDHGEVLASFHLSDCSKSPEDEVVAMEYLPDQQALLAVSKSGNFILSNDCTSQTELAGSVTDGLLAMAWSPDLELAALVSAELNVLLVTADLESIFEAPLFSDEFGDMAPVTVGWGRKETQFHGSAGKEAARRREEAPPDADSASRDDRRPRVTWRGDGQMFAVGAVCPSTGGRRFVVFARDGGRLSTSEPVTGLGQSLAWRPSGAILASVQRLPNKLQTVFFEKNGLRHGEFTLPFSPDAAHVRELLWSPDSAVLAVWLEVDGADSTESRVQLWSTGNYHWYCKQEHVFAADDAVVAVSWRPTSDLRLLVATAGGRLLSVSYQWSSSCAGRSAVAAVVDGRRLLVTPLAATVVPPPLSAHELHLPAAVNAVWQGPAGAADWLWAATSDRRLHAFKQLLPGQQPSAAGPADCSMQLTAGGGNGFAVRAPLHAWRASCGLQAVPAAPTWAWQLVTAGRLVCAARPPDGWQLWLLDAQLPETAAAGAGSVTLSVTVPLQCAAVLVSAVGGGSAQAVVHTEDGRFLLLDADTGQLTPLTDPGSGQELRLPVPAEQVDVVRADDGRQCVVALTPQRRLYVDGREILAGCTSFAVADDFLLVTTLEQTLRCLPLAVLLDARAGTEVPWSEVAARRLERGARLVTAVGGDTRLVLQMPRGNLEVIHPRPLVVARLARLMDRGEYYTAYAEMRRHRINLNLLADHAPETFAERCDDICRSLRSEPNWLCVFISDLSAEDVTQTLYRDTYGPRPAAAAAPDKVDTVCELVRASLERLDRSRLLLPLLTTLVRPTKPRLEEALRVISQLRAGGADGDGPADSGEGRVTADAALRYLICIVDVDELYSVALGTYDFELVIMVAEKSQKDPKEYLPFLNELRRLPESYGRYRIDRHLRRPRRALRHLVAAGADHRQEVLKFVAEHDLYPQALELYTPGSPEYRAVCGLYADHLDAAGHSWEAGAFYVRAGAQTSAVDALRRAGAWRDCLQTATQLGMPRDQFRELCASLATELRAAGRCADAAEIYERHLRQPDEQVACLLEGRLWSAAVQACHQARKPAMVAVLVLPALQRAAAAMSETLARISETFEQRRARLAAVRELHRQQQSRRAQLADAELAGPESDLYSDTSSVSAVSGSSATSGSSSRTFRSSKSRRKQERKKYSLREGSGQEDLALVAACHALVSEAYGLTDDMKWLLRALVQHGQDAAAGDIQRAYGALLADLERAAGEVWPEPAAEQPQPAAFGPAATANSIVSQLRAGGDDPAAARLALLEPHLRYPPMAKKDLSWKLICLERPSSDS